MTIVESIKCVLQNNHSGLTSKQIYDEIIRRGLYIFGAENPVGVVNAQLRRRCAGLDFPTAYPVKFFEIAGYEGKKIKFRLLSEEKEMAAITTPKIPDSSELLPEEKIMKVSSFSILIKESTKEMISNAIYASRKRQELL